jgi:hypothetical protein
MASMRKLNRRLLAWRRYAHRTYWNPRVTSPRWLRPGSAVLCSPGHTRAWDAVQLEEERRFWDETPEIWLGGPAGEAALIADVLGDDVPCYTGPCFDCGLPDTYRGQGDGIGSCECPRCERCGSGPGCDCRDDDEFFCGDPDCSCGDPDDDAGHADDWEWDAARTARPIETVDTGGLL